MKPKRKTVVNEWRKALTDLMPFILEDYYPDYPGADPAYVAAVEEAIRLTGIRREDVQDCGVKP